MADSMKSVLLLNSDGYCGKQQPKLLSWFKYLISTQSKEKHKVTSCFYDLGIVIYDLRILSCSGRLSVSRTNENIVKIPELVLENHYRTINDISDMSAVSWSFPPTNIERCCRWHDVPAKCVSRLRKHRDEPRLKACHELKQLEFDSGLYFRQSPLESKAEVSEFADVEWAKMKTTESPKGITLQEFLALLQNSEKRDLSRSDAWNRGEYFEGNKCINVWI